jgi:hypothetical protein
MSILISDWIHTSNDLLQRLMSKHTSAVPTYQIISQSAEEVQNIENAPAISMGPYLVESGQTILLRRISIYSLRGECREQMRLLYMNDPAIQVWKEMGKPHNIIGAQIRPPHSALLTLGVPFSG